MVLARAAGDSAMVGGSAVEQMTKIRDKSVRSTCDTDLTGWADTPGSICMGRGPIISFRNTKNISNPRTRSPIFSTWPASAEPSPDSANFTKISHEARLHNVPGRNTIYNIKTYNM